MKLKLTKIWQFMVGFFVLIIIDPFIHILGEKLIGFSGMFLAAFIMAVLFFILIIMWMNFVSEAKKRSERLRGEYNVAMNISNQDIRIKNYNIWKKISSKNKLIILISATIFIIIILSAYYFYVKPRNEKNIYNECVYEVNKNSNVIKFPLAASIQKLQIDACVKAGGVKNYSKNKKIFFPFDLINPPSDNKK
ncbi:MAG TPA: hypothetical protein P5548_00710 [Candidatus Moranbacteria bacterium]|nr:hypothetical protein [Candidatus Moranbacteria bacterium]HRZ33413.1 hypothetical protein [Candidatus Moranbacteria bacterium]